MAVSLIHNESSHDQIAQELHMVVHQWVQRLIDHPDTPPEYEIWQHSESDPSLHKFFLEAVVATVGEIIFLYVCRDKGIIDFDCINNHYTFQNEQNSIRRLFDSAFEWRVLNWWAPPEEFFTDVKGIISKYHFASISRDIVGKLYQLIVGKEDRKLLGEFYTPDEVVNYILDGVGCTSSVDLNDKLIIDLSCGSGRFLTVAVARMISSLTNSGHSDSEILKIVCSSVIGLDINPFACYLAELNILMQLIDIIAIVRSSDQSYILPRLHIYTTNTIEGPGLLSKDEDVVFEIKTRSGRFSDGFDFVVGNPPYVEAKKMDVSTKRICKQSCPDVATGAFDLYICFIDLGFRLLKNGGCLGYIIPNKFTIANYARVIRKKLLTESEIMEIIDVSECGIFEKTSVYPIIITARKAKPSNAWMIRTAEHVKSPQQLREHSITTTTIPQSLYNFGDNTFYILPAASIENGLLLKLLDRSFVLLEEYLTVKWTISFHATGLREQFLFSERPDTSYARKLIGGKSFAGNTDIGRYRLDWGGWWIDYDEERARKHNNQLPPRQLFERDKIIICQNSLRLRATYDDQHYYCKDTFFVAYLNDLYQDNISLKFVLGLLNSKLLHYFYANIFKGTHVAGGYLHYLTGYLNRLPMAITLSEQRAVVEEYVERLLGAVNDDIFNSIDSELDEYIYDLYKLSDEEKAVIRSFS